MEIEYYPQDKYANASDTQAHQMMLFTKLNCRVPYRVELHVHIQYIFY